MKDCIFYFEFNVDFDGSTEDGIFVKKAFVIRDVVDFDIDGDCPEWVFNAAEDLEERYGVHDWGSSPSDEVYGIGYSSGEVKLKNIDKLMEKWRRVFIKNFGADKVSEVVDVDYEYDDNDYYIYLKTVELLDNA